MNEILLEILKWIAAIVLGVIIAIPLTLLFNWLTEKYNLDKYELNIFGLKIRIIDNEKEK